MNKRDYQICRNCVMDTSDPTISFDARGICDHCNDYFLAVKPRWNVGEEGQKTLRNIVHQIKRSGARHDFDCLLGLSGGIDSSYMLHMMVTQFGLRPLVFHVDGGWNSELAVHNIHVLIDKLNLDLYTEVIDWNEMRDFQLAWFKSGVPHIDIPQDHAFVATLYDFAQKYRINYILNGGNISTEVVRYPKQYFYYGTDLRHIRDVISRFGTLPMTQYPFSSTFRHKIYLRYVRRVKVVKPLNYIPYTRADALALLETEYDWKPYPQKHFESRFTRFFEGYWLPVRFGFDVRRVQYSSLILTEQMKRDDALQALEHPPYDAATIAHDFSYIATKLGISDDELHQYLEMPKRYYWDYRNQHTLLDFGARLLRYLHLDRAGLR